MELDGHSSQQPFPHFDVVRFVDGLEDLLGGGHNTTAPAPAATQATTGSVTDSQQAKPSTTVAHGMIEHEILTLYPYSNVQ